MRFWPNKKDIIALCLCVLAGQSGHAQSAIKRCQRILKLSPITRLLPARFLRPNESAWFAEILGQRYHTRILSVLKRLKSASDGRKYFKLYEDDYVTVWAIKWENKTTKIHDHLESEVGIHVLKGEIIEEQFFPPNPNPIKKLYGPGKSIGLSGVPHVHTIRGDGNAVSIHVYSPPLRTMTYYEEAEGNLTPKNVAPEEH